jgi:hypothetical protein
MCALLVGTINEDLKIKKYHLKAGEKVKKVLREILNCRWLKFLLLGLIFEV